MPRAIYPITISILILAASSAVAKPPENKHVWDPDVRSVAAFKNGIGFFIREGEVTLRDGWCISGPVPPALFGTLAIYALDDKHTVDIVGSGPGEVVEFDGRDGPADVPGKIERLRACIGLNVALSFDDDDTTLVSQGQLEEVTGDFAIVKQAGQLHATRIADLSELQVLDYPLRIHVEGAPPNGRVRLGMAYLRRGVTWVPEYSLGVTGEASAELTLRATLVNEVEDLVHADVHFVVGVPSFVHENYLSPLAVEQAIRSTAATLPPQFNTQQLVSNAIMTRGGMAHDQRPNAQGPAQPTPAVDSGDPRAVERLVSGLPQMGGAGASDFTVYTKEDLTLRRGEKVMVTVFQAAIRYTHFYRWESPGPLRHFLVLHNETDTAWTTGPVIAVSERRPLCQDTIKYTPRGSWYELPVTTAVNVSTEAAESEIDRKLKAHEPQHNFFFDLVTIEGRLAVRNMESRPIELAIARQVPGLLVTASDNGRTQQDTNKLKLIERHGIVHWTVRLKPGEQKNLTYRYERYVESR